jgi:hypothetical protein
MRILSHPNLMNSCHSEAPQAQRNLLSSAAAPPLPAEKQVPLRLRRFGMTIMNE